MKILVTDMAKDFDKKIKKQIQEKQNLNEAFKKMLSELERQKINRKVKK